MHYTSWRNQDILSLTAAQWKEHLCNPEIFDDDILGVVCYVFLQPNATSTATDIGRAFCVHANAVTAWNRKAAKNLYAYYHAEPPLDDRGQNRYWNIIFDGNLDCVMDKKKHFYWVLRPNLVAAIA